jgi:Flp pilus assembly CpaE family ATPase
MRAFLISPIEAQRKQFEAAIEPHRSISLSKILDQYPSPDVLSRLVRAWAPEVIFLGMEDAEAAEAISRQITKEFPSVQQVALHSSQEPWVFRHVLSLRMRELLVSPVSPEELAHSLDQLALHLDAHPADVGSTKKFFAFLPAKAGAGASSIAANTTWALSNVPDTSVLLADFDLHSGVTGFLFDTDHEYSINDAATRGRELDDEAWLRLTKKIGNIDLLLSGAPRMRDAISPIQVSHLIDFARRNYSVINADLPDTFDEISLAVLREANQIFLVTTPELSALRLARLKALLLRQLELEEKASLVVNRVAKSNELSLQEIEETVGLPVVASFPSDYAGMTAAARQGRPAAKLAPHFQRFAEKIMDKKPLPEKRARFIERFAMVPARYSFR